MRGLVLLLTLWASPAQALDWFDIMGKGLYITRAGDVISTEVALARGAREGNPLMKRRTFRIASLAMAPAIFYATKRIHKTRPRLAFWLRVGAVVGWGSVMVHNLRVV